MTAAGPAWWPSLREHAITYGCVASGSVIGGCLRFIVGVEQQVFLGPAVPWATLFVNVTGSFIIGFYATITAPDGRIFASTRQRQFVMAGICGGYTSFSAFSLDTLLLVRSGHGWLALANIGVAPLGWLVSVWLGAVLGKLWSSSSRRGPTADDAATAEPSPSSTASGVATVAAPLMLRIPQHAALLRIFVGESDRSGDRPLYEAIVLKAREQQMAGATVLRGPSGFGRSRLMHGAERFQLAGDRPLIIEIIDSEEAMAKFLPALNGIMKSGMVTLEKAEVLKYGPSRARIDDS